MRFLAFETTYPTPHNTYIGRLDQVRDSDERLTVLRSYFLLKREQREATVVERVHIHGIGQLWDLQPRQSRRASKDARWLFDGFPYVQLVISPVPNIASISRCESLVYGTIFA